MVKFFQAGGHYLIGLATIGAMAGLVATGNVDASVGVPVITGTAAVLIGGQLGLNVPATTVSAAPVSPASASGGSGPAGVGSAGTAG